MELLYVLLVMALLCLPLLVKYIRGRKSDKSNPADPLTTPQDLLSEAEVYYAYGREADAMNRLQAIRNHYPDSQEAEKILKAQRAVKPETLTNRGDDQAFFLASMAVLYSHSSTKGEHQEACSPDTNRPDGIDTSSSFSDGGVGCD